MFRKFEVKELLEERQGLQYWRKQTVQLEEDFVLKAHKLHELNDLLRAHSKQLEHPTERLQQWTTPPIDRIVRVAKTKFKSAGEESAELELWDLFSPQQKWRFTSKAYEHDKFERLLEIKL